ncbi:MAG: carbohydrate ABC transporter substrate-binding protein, partial [Staphylothermus sp.]|nr:carbohydrate ABC transporter substrate-binding protein [Staphylothermus sp.]
MSTAPETSKLVIVAVVTFIIGILVGYGIGYVTITPQQTTVTTTVTKSQVTTVTQQQTTPAQKVKLIVIGPWAGDEMKAFKQVLDKFVEEHPNIEVEYRIYRAEDLASIAPPQFEAGMAPGDVIFSAWGWWVKEMGEKGHLMDLSDLVNEDEYIKGIFDPVKSGDKIYGLPFTAWAKPGFWYRKSFFQEYGLKEPKTWDEFKQLLDKIKQIPGIEAPIVTGDSVGWPISDITEHFIITFGGIDMQLKLINGELKFNDPQVKTIFENYIVQLIKEGYFSEPIEWTKAIEEWWSSKYALYFMGTWLTGMVDDP